jgi:hypothetical protein
MAAKQPELRVNRTIARVEIGRLVDGWEELHHLVSGPLSGKSTQDIQEARELFPRLSDKTTAALTRIFESGSFAAQFQALPMPCIGGDESNRDVRKALAAAGTKRIDWLTKLQNDLDKFPESGRITVGGPR